MNQLGELTDKLIAFRDERDWKQFHNPKDLAIALNVEASELLELFLWKAPEDASKQDVAEELADILAYALMLAHHYNFDLNDIVRQKIEKNAQKYPVDKARGNATKYTDL
jgi:NTP pyrophosphatase (non-canonical NTP hydrolase)